MSRVIDLAGPEGNVFHVAGIAKAWNRQLGKPYSGRVNLLDATTNRLDGREGDYNDVLDTFDGWFSGLIDYEFVNDPRDPVTTSDDCDAEWDEYWAQNC